MSDLALTNSNRLHTSEQFAYFSIPLSLLIQAQSLQKGKGI